MSDATFQCHLIASTDATSIAVVEDMTVGRADSCGLVIKTGQISRQHAQLFPCAEGLWVDDLKSSNGTFINDIRIAAKMLARHGDIIRFDSVAYKVEHTLIRQVNNDEATILARADEATILAASAPIKAVSASQPQAVVEAKPDAVLPPAWAMQRQQSVDGTEILDGAIAQKMQSSRSSAVESVTVPTLIGKTQPILGVRFALNAAGNTGEWEIGRAESATIVIDHISVSGSHAQLVQAGARWKLIDLVSANGTFVNDTKGLTTYLTHGDRLRFGQIECVFLLPQSHVSETPAQPTTAQQAKNKNSQASRKPANLLFIGILIAIIGLSVALILKQ